MWIWNHWPVLETERWLGTVLGIRVKPFFDLWDVSILLLKSFRFWLPVTKLFDSLIYQSPKYNQVSCWMSCWISSVESIQPKSHPNRRIKGYSDVKPLKTKQTKSHPKKNPITKNRFLISMCPSRTRELDASRAVFYPILWQSTNLRSITIHKEIHRPAGCWHPLRHVYPKSHVWRRKNDIFHSNLNFYTRTELYFSKH